MVCPQITMTTAYIAASDIFNGEWYYRITIQCNNPANWTSITQFGETPTHWFWEMNACYQLWQQCWQYFLSRYPYCFFGSEYVHTAIYFFLIQISYLYTLTTCKPHSRFGRIAVSIVCGFYRRTFCFFF